MIVSYDSNNAVSHKPSIVEGIIKQGVANAPLIEMLGAKGISNFKHSWLTDKYRDAGDNSNLEVTSLGTTPTSTKQKTDNICQIVKNEFGVSWRQEKVAQYGEKELDYQRAREGIHHLKDKEYALLGLNHTDVYNAPIAGSATVAPKMAGIFYYVPTANKLVGDDGSGGIEEFTLQSLHDLIEPLWKNGATDGGDTFNVIMGTVLKARVNSWLDDKPYLRVDVKDNRLDPRVTKIATDFGNIDIILHRLFTGDKLKDKIIAGDFSYAKLCYLDNTRLEPVSTDKTAVYERYYTDFTLEVTDNEKFACAENFN